MRKKRILALLITVFIAVFTFRELFISHYRHKYEGYKLYELYIDEDNQFKIDQTKFYQSAKVLHRQNYELMRILLPPNLDLEFSEYLKEQQVKFQKISDNFAELGEKQIVNKRPKRSATESLIDFTSYHRYEAINNYLLSLANKYPDKARIYFAGKSYEGRDLNALYISNASNLNFTMGRRPTIIIDAGIHAREWIAPATALYIIQQLVENSEMYNTELALFDWLILPLVNPDGYEYSHVTDRLWRKNRKPSGKMKNGTECIGTDLNRNFGYKWGFSGSSRNPCSIVYQGATCFSEPESVALRDMLIQFNSSGFMYLTLHSFGPSIMYPWGYKRSTVPNSRHLYNIAHAGAKVLKEATGTDYEIGTRSIVLYPSSGSSDDFAYGELNLLSFCLELSPGGNDFDPPNEQILPIVSESWLGIRAMSIEAYWSSLRSKADFIPSNILKTVTMKFFQLFAEI